jgi:hypothetical protein
MRKPSTARQQDPRVTPLSVSMTLSERKKVVKAARKAGESLSAFLRRSALERIERDEQVAA